VYKVFSYFKREADAGMPVDDVAKAQFVFISVSSRHPHSFQPVTSESASAHNKYN
jgi:hypothetical protein